MSSYQGLLTQITTDIVTLEILTHTPILTNTTTEITLENSIHKTKKEIEKENTAMQKRIKQTISEQERQLEEFEKAERQKQKEEKQREEREKKKQEANASKQPLK